MDLLEKALQTGKDLIDNNKTEEIIETYQDLPKASNKEILEFLREQITVVLKKAGMNRKIFVVCFNTILLEIEKRME